MRNTMKTVFAVLYSTAVCLNVLAQENTNESVALNASVTVQGALSITKDADVDFGNISATTDDVVRLVPDGSSSSYVGSNAVTGKLTISGAPGADVLITYPAGITLIANETDQIAFSMHVYGNDEDIQASALQLSAEGIAGENVTGLLNATTGDYFLYVGGALGGTVGTPGALTDQAAGEYTGTVTFEVKYN
jgi:hypothetical protein